MQRTPDAIIAEFEFRQRTANDARRKRFLHRAIDIAQIALALVALIVVTDRVAPPASKPYAIFVGVLVFSFDEPDSAIRVLVKKGFKVL